MVPEGWEEKHFSEIAEINPKKSAKPESGVVSFIPMDAVSESAQLIRTEKRLYDDVCKGFTSFKDNDVLVAKITPCFENGKGAFVANLSNEIGFGSTEFHVLRARKNSSPLFIYYLTTTREFRVRGEMNMQGSAGQKRVTTNYLKLYKVNVPPLQEQKKITQILSTWDKAITTTEKILKNSLQQKKALMQQLLTGKKRLLDDSGVRFSGEWKEYELNSLGDTYTGLSGKSKKDFGKGRPYIPYINIFRNSKVDLDNLDYVNIGANENQSVAKYGDIFFTTSSEVPQEVGMSSVLLDKAEELYLNSFCFGFRLKGFEILSPQYAQYLFRSETIRRSITKLAQGATRYNLSKKQLLKLQLKIPSVSEQIAIFNVLTSVDREISLLQQKLNSFKQEKKALMQQLLTGKRRVKIQ